MNDAPPDAADVSDAPSVDRGALRVEALGGPRDLAALSDEWDRLDRQLSPRTPFTSPLWNLLWWQHLRARQPLVRDDFFVHVVRDAAGALVAIAPLMLTHRPSFGPLRLRHLQFFGADINLTEVRGLVCRPQDQPRVMRALARHLLARADEWDWVEWAGIRGDGAVEGLAAQPQRRAPPTCGYLLALPESWNALRAGLSRNIKESLRKCYNSLRREGHEFAFHVRARPDEVAPGLARFFALHAARARTAGTVAHADVFGSEAARGFLRAYAGAMAARGQLRVFQLELGGKVVATRLGFVLGDALYLYYSGYDPAWGRFSVMTTLLAEAIKWAIDQRLRVVNLSTGQDVSKLRWGPEAVAYGRVFLPAPTLRGRLAFHAYDRLLRSARNGSSLGRVLDVARRTS